MLRTSFISRNIFRQITDYITEVKGFVRRSMLGYPTLGGEGVFGGNSAFEFCCGAMRWRITTGPFDRAPFFVTVEELLCRV